MIVNPGVNAYPLSTREARIFENRLGRIFTDPEIDCLLKYKVGIGSGIDDYKGGISDIDLLCLTKKTVTDKRKLSEIGEEIRELYEYFGEAAGLPKGVDMDLTVHDTPTFSKYGLTSFRPSFARLFEESKILAGKYSQGIEISKQCDREMMHIAKNLSQLRQYPLMKHVILRFNGADVLANTKWNYLIKIVDLPYLIYTHFTNDEIPKTRDEAIEKTEDVLKHVSHEPLKALLNSKKSLPDKMHFLGSENSDGLLLDGITWYEEIIGNILP